jgi:hypothetical protein
MVGASESNCKPLTVGRPLRLDVGMKLFISGYPHTPFPHHFFAAIIRVNKGRYLPLFLSREHAQKKAIEGTNG